MVNNIPRGIVHYYKLLDYLYVMLYTAEIHVMPLKELLDPQGKAVEQGLHNLGFQCSNVRIGRNITLKIEADTKDAAIVIVEEACKKLLHNPVMEYYAFTVSE